MSYRVMTEDEIVERFKEAVDGVADAILNLLGADRATRYDTRFAVYVEPYMDGQPVRAMWLHQQPFDFLPFVIVQVEKVGFRGEIAAKVADNLIKGLFSGDIPLPGFHSPMGRDDLRFYERTP